MKLDKSLPYSETLGPSVARYHQDGRDFDSQGNEIGTKAKAIDPPDTRENTLATAEETIVKRKPGRPAKVVQ